MKTRIAAWVVGLSFLILIFLALTGCKSATQQADKLNDNIQKNTVTITKAASDAQADIASADQKVATATTQPGNPVATVTLLNGAHGDLGNAAKHLAPIAPAAANISQDSTKAAAVTAKTEQKLVAERDHWVGYKGRVLLWSLAGFALALGVIVFIAKTAGGGPIIAAISEVVLTVVKAIYAYVLRPIGVFFYHLFTLGLGAFANKVNKKYDEQQAKNVNGTPAPAPAK
jgi:hypothetical protein